MVLVSCANATRPHVTSNRGVAIVRNTIPTPGPAPLSPFAQRDMSPIAVLSFVPRPGQ